MLFNNNPTFILVLYFLIVVLYNSKRLSFVEGQKEKFEFDKNSIKKDYINTME